MAEPDAYRAFVVPLPSGRGDRPVVEQTPEPLLALAEPQRRFVPLVEVAQNRGESPGFLAGDLVDRELDRNPRAVLPESFDLATDADHVRLAAAEVAREETVVS